MKLFIQISIWLVSATATCPLSAQEVVLRDLTTIPNATISAFDPDFVQLSTGLYLGWHQVLSGVTRDPDRQAEFDRSLRTLGDPLMRLHLRLRSQDWDGAGRIAESQFNPAKLHDDLRTTADPEADKIGAQQHYLIAMATMQWRLNHGRRVEAVLPFMLAAKCQPTVPQSALDLVGNHVLRDDEVKHQFSDRIEPVWFDIGALESTYGNLVVEQQSQKSVLPGWHLYLASMAIDLGQLDSAQQHLDQLPADRSGWPPMLQSNRSLIEARLLWERGQRDRAREQFQGDQPLARYYRGALVESRQTELTAAILTLVQIAALDANEHANLAAAALHRAAQLSRQRDDEHTAKKLEDELLRAFPETYHARIQRLQSR